MYIEAKSRKKKYALYLVHSKRIDGKSKKLLNKYLGSIEKEGLIQREHDEKSEIVKDIVEQLREDINRKVKEIPKEIMDELQDEFENYGLLELLLVKIRKLITKENEY